MAGTELMLMGSLENAKRQMIREVIQTNLENRAAKVRHKRLRWQILRWARASLMTVSAVFAISFFVISRGKASSSIAVNATAVVHQVLEPRTAEPPVPVTPPSDVNLSVLPLSVKRIVIDPGHGGDQAGAVSNTGLAEKDVTLDIALRLRQLMKQSPFEVLLTRETDQTVTLASRVAFANSKKADLFVSIHINWLQPRSIRPLETYYVGATNDPQVLQLASLENRHSGYSLSEYRQLLEKVYLDTRRNESHTLAKTVDAELYRSLKPLNPNLDDRGAKMAPFAVLVGTQMPAVLAEVSSLSNDEDDKLLKNEQYKQKIAVALFEAISTYAKNLNTSGKRGGAPNGTT
jgi:N-acetylmuramoyl-L-alanine amidase